jgi:hypothetical protein
MRVHSFTRYVALAAVAGTLACASRTARTEGADETAAARDTTTVEDTLTGEGEAPAGYQGMERDTALVPPQEGTPTDTFLQQQGQGTPQDTAGYGGLERPDTTGQAQTDTTGFGQDTTGAAAQDTAGMGADTTNPNPSGTDTTGMTDTTGYNPSQESQDTVPQ